MAAGMKLAHLTLATAAVQRTAAFLEATFGCARVAAPANSPIETCWLDAGRGQQVHLVHVDGYAASSFEGEFGRHVAVFYPAGELPALRERLERAGAAIVAPLRATTFERFFFRDPINGYVFEVIAEPEQPARD